MNLEQFLITDEEIAVLRRIQAKCYGQSKAMGWHNKPREMGTRIALMHSELSEALEADRKDLMDDHLPHRKGSECEFADCVIRILDTAGYENLDIGSALAEKLAYNANREDHKLENREKVGGKKY